MKKAIKQATEHAVAPRSALEQYPSTPVSHGQSDTYDISGAGNDDALIGLWLSGRPTNTVRAYKSDIEQMRCHVAKALRQVTAADLITYAETLVHLSKASQHRKLSATKSLFSYALKLGYLRLDPAAALRMPKPSYSRAQKLLSAEAVHSIIDAATPGRDRLICRTLYLLGVREAELIALRASDIRQTATGHAITIQGKGSKERTIAVPDTLAADLTAHRQSGVIFQGATGKPVAASTIYRMVRKAGHNVGYNISPHVLRHCCASHSLDAGCPIHVVKATLGHSSLATTSIYSHASPDDSAGLYLSDQ